MRTVIGVASLLVFAVVAIVLYARNEQPRYRYGGYGRGYGGYGYYDLRRIPAEGKKSEGEEPQRFLLDQAESLGFDNAATNGMARSPILNKEQSIDHWSSFRHTIGRKCVKKQSCYEFADPRQAVNGSVRYDSVVSCFFAQPAHGWFVFEDKIRSIMSQHSK
jgi:hypothetical protein